MMQQETEKDGILITGATGFLGAHLVAELALNTDYKLICLVRGGTADEAENKFIASLQFYFGSQAGDILGKTELLYGDLNLENFGLDEDAYEQLGSSVSHFIHAGAIVRFFGRNEDFEQTNVIGTNTVIGFCQRFQIFLLYTSSVAVYDSNDRREANWTYRPEAEVDIYTLSKMKAEKSILAQVEQGRLRAAIVRLGALAGRYSDGVFQKNMAESSVYTIIKTIIATGKMPENFLDSQIELLPVDLCSRGLIKLLTDNKEGVFCFFNHNIITYQELCSLLKDIHIEIEVKDYPTFQDYLAEISDCGLDDRDLFTGFYLHYKRTKNKPLISIKCNTEASNRYLANNNLKWPRIDQNYLLKIVNYMEQAGFLKG